MTPNNARARRLRWIAAGFGLMLIPSIIAVFDPNAGRLAGVLALVFWFAMLAGRASKVGRG